MNKFWVLGALLALVLYEARGVLPPFIIAAVLAYIVSPVIDETAARTGRPRRLVVVIFFAAILGLFGLLVWLIETRLVRQIQELAVGWPALVDQAFVLFLGGENIQFLGRTLDPHLMAEQTVTTLNDALGNPTDALHFAERALDVVLKSFLTLVAFFYLLLDGRRLFPFILEFVPEDQHPRLRRIADRIHLVLGRYLRGQFLLVMLMSGVTYLVLTLIFRLPYALPLSIMTGVLEVLPFVGPVAAGAIASLVAVVHGGPAAMLGVAVAYLILRQLEDQLVMPIVVGRAVDLHPLATIFSVLVGGSIAGILGAVLAVPVAAAVKVTLDSVFEAQAAYGDG